MSSTPKDALVAWNCRCGNLWRIFLFPKPEGHNERIADSIQVEVAHGAYMVDEGFYWNTTTTATIVYYMFLTITEWCEEQKDCSIEEGTQVRVR